MVRKVSSKENKFIKMARQLNQKKVRDKTGLFLLEGIRSLEDIGRSNYEIEAILINSSFKEKDASEDLLSKFKTVPILEVEDKVFKEISLTETTQGVLLIVHKKQFILESVLDNEPKIIVIADGIQDPGNLGTILRTSAAAGTSALLVTRGCVDVYNPKVVRASMGGIFFLPVINVDNLESLITLLNIKGYKLVVADLEGKQMYYDAELKEPVALIIGNENNGPSELFKEKSDLVVKIPMLGKVESLNAGVAAGVLIYETIRQNSI